MNRLTAGVFAVLVLATIGAFFVAQRLKNAPPVVGEIGIRPVFSPNGDGRFDGPRVTLRRKASPPRAGSGTCGGARPATVMR